MAPKPDPWGKGAGGGKNTCSSCSGRGEKKQEVKEVYTENGKQKTRTKTVYVTCTSCGGSGSK